MAALCETPSHQKQHHTNHPFHRRACIIHTQSHWSLVTVKIQSHALISLARASFFYVPVTLGLVIPEKLAWQIQPSYGSALQSAGSHLFV